MKARMKVVSCICAMAIMAGAGTAWGGGVMASATIDFNNPGGPLPNQIAESAAGMITSVNTVIQSTTFDGAPAPSPRPAAPFDSLNTVVAAGASGGVGYDVMDPTSSYFAQSHVVNYVNAASQSLPDANLDNLDYQATAQNNVYGSARANAIVAFQFLFTATTGQTLTVTANTIDLMLNSAYDPGMSATFRYLFTVIDPVTMLDIDTANHVAVTRTYNATQIGLVDGLEQLYQYTYTTPSTLSGNYILLLEAEQTASVPEPGTFVLAGSGLLGLFLLRRRSRQG